MPENAATMHNVIIEDRKKISMTGITDVGSFDEETLNIQSVQAAVRNRISATALRTVFLLRTPKITL